MMYLKDGSTSVIPTNVKKMTLSGTYNNILLFGAPELEVTADTIIENLSLSPNAGLQMNANTVIGNLTLPNNTRVIHNSGSFTITDTLSFGSGTIFWNVHKTVTSLPTVQNLNIPSGTTLTTSAHTGTYNYLLALNALGNLTVQS